MDRYDFREDGAGENDRRRGRRETRDETAAATHRGRQGRPGVGAEGPIEGGLGGASTAHRRRELAADTRLPRGVEGTRSTSEDQTSRRQGQDGGEDEDDEGDPVEEACCRPDSCPLPPRVGPGDRASRARRTVALPRSSQT